jgi:hypothetical protein
VAGFHDKLELTHELEGEGTPGALFTARVIDRGLREARVDSWATAAQSLEPLGEPVHRVSGDGREAAFYDRDALILHVGLFSGWIHVQLAGDDTAQLEATLAELRKLFAPPDPTSTQTVPVTFWTYGPQGPMASSRSISVPQWADIEENYPAAVRSELDGLMRRFEPAHGGQLILWHGKVGTGKTFALRALAWEWRNWCELHYIVDPDSFFGQHADYLMSVLTQPGYAEFADPRFGPAMEAVGWTGYGVDDGFDGDENEGEAKAWWLLVLEDTGELLTPDAKSIIGQGLSRFLNVVDGLIGQGLRILVLVTTNEEIKTLHPAVARPGRCAANIEFGPLGGDEASQWLERRGVAERAERPTPIATLYALAEGRESGAVTPAGFAG